MKGINSLHVVPEQEARFSNDPYNKKALEKQLDAFTDRHGLKSLRDRLRNGLNEVAILAFDRTNNVVKEVVRKMAPTPEEAEKLYTNLVDTCVEMQKFGPWGFAEELANPTSPEIKGWFIVTGAETIGYDRSMDLNDIEFIENTKRIEHLLEEAVTSPEDFFQRAHEHMVKRSEAAIRFQENDTEHRVPFGEGFATFLPMAIQGYESGVVQDAEGWVFVGARGEISDDLLTSVGLQKEVAPDERDPNRMVTYFSNNKGQRVVKKVHPGLLVILSRSFDLASSIVRALNNDHDALEIAEDALGHTRVIQTTEKERQQLGINGDNFNTDFLKVSRQSITDALSSSTELIRPRMEFYNDLLFVRGNYVYVDALQQLQRRRTSEGTLVTDHEKKILGGKIWKKMQQKTDELRYVNDLLDAEFASIPKGITSVIDMAGGAGDLGLAVSNEFLSRGREITRVEIVDPQTGVADFMQTIIEHLPFRTQMEEVAVHTTGYLQDAHIAPDSIVVAKHACGPLTDAVIEQWRHSESPMLVAMTCCQGKAKGEPAPYGFSQEEWDRLCQESDLTNTNIPDAPGKARDRAISRLETGNQAMKKIDMARVTYLRRHGFKAELKMTDKFPKGDVIIARRLPQNFMKQLEILKKEFIENPTVFQALLKKLNNLATGRNPQGFNRDIYGDDWVADDFAELTRRLIEPASDRIKPAPVIEITPLSTNNETIPNEQEVKKQQKKITQEVFVDYKGRIDQYVIDRTKRIEKILTGQEMGAVITSIKNRLFQYEGEPATNIRQGIDTLMNDLGL